MPTHHIDAAPIIEVVRRHGRQFDGGVKELLLEDITLYKAYKQGVKTGWFSPKHIDELAIRCGLMPQDIYGYELWESLPVLDSERNGRRRVRRRGQPRSERVSLKQVAAAAGVSYSTACAAINGRSNGSPETTERVRKIAAEMGYDPGGYSAKVRAAASAPSASERALEADGASEQASAAA